MKVNGHKGVTRPRSYEGGGGGGEKGFCSAELSGALQTSKQSYSIQFLSRKNS